MKYKALSVLILASLFFGKQQLVNSSPVVNNSANLPMHNSETLNSKWHSFSSETGGFTILMPGTPEEVTTNTGLMNINFFLLKQDSNLYTVSYIDFPMNIQEIDSDLILNPLRDSFIASLGGELLSELVTSLQDYPGKEIKVKFLEANLGIYRMYLVQNRIYIVGVMTHQDRTLSVDILNFLDSFQLLKSKVIYNV